MIYQDIEHGSPRLCAICLGQRIQWWQFLEMVKVGDNCMERGWMDGLLSTAAQHVALPRGLPGHA